MRNLEELQSIIKEKECLILSQGAFNELSILASVYDLITYYNLDESNLKSEIALCIGLENEVYSAQTEYFYGNLRSTGCSRDKSVELWNNEIYDLLSSLSPEGYVFTSREYNGTEIGWFKLM